MTLSKEIRIVFIGGVVTWLLSVFISFTYQQQHALQSHDVFITGFVIFWILRLFLTPLYIRHKQNFFLYGFGYVCLILALIIPAIRLYVSGDLSVAYNSFLYGILFLVLTYFLWCTSMLTPIYLGLVSPMRSRFADTINWLWLFLFWVIPICIWQSANAPSPIHFGRCDGEFFLKLACSV